MTNRWRISAPTRVNEATTLNRLRFITLKNKEISKIYNDCVINVKEKEDKLVINDNDIDKDWVMVLLALLNSEREIKVSKKVMAIIFQMRQLFRRRQLKI